MADRDPPTGSRRLKIAARMPESEIPQGKPADWLLWDEGQYTMFDVFLTSTVCLYVQGFLVGQVTSHDWSLGYYFNVMYVVAWYIALLWHLFHSCSLAWVRSE